MTDLEDTDSKPDLMEEDNASHNCPHCEKTFKKVYRLTRHIYKEHVRPTCTACSDSFFRMKELKEHALTSHELKMNKLCSICKKAYTSRLDLQNHLKADHIDDRPFLCGKCQRMFSDEERLKSHMAIHKKMGLIQCFDCTMTFSSTFKLSRHRRASHGDIKSMQCPDCGENFQADEALRKRICELHMGAESQTESKPFFCKYCEAEFKTPRDVNIHIRTEHVDKRPFKCDKCPFIFETEEEVDKHFQRRHAPRNFSCDLCRRRYANENTLKRHVTSFHRGQLNENDTVPNGNLVKIEKNDQDDQLQNGTPITNGLPVEI